MEKQELIKEKLDSSGLFDFAGLYNYAHFWLKEEKNYGVTEERYDEKVSGSSKDLRIEWRALKSMSDYFLFEIKVKYLVTGMTDVEVEVDGKKKKMNKGRVFMEIKGTMIRDPESHWDRTPFYRFLRDVYNKYIVPSRIDAMTDTLRYEVSDLKEDLKAFMDLVGKR